MGGELARNVWDRAVAVLPSVDQLWYKYVHMEELLGAVANARQFELRYGEVGRALGIYERLLREQPWPGAFVQ
ncbi:hypothetical protein E2562_003570 [Oryza meyeriana var. granulata]|uniref:Uncharacterized protein n=1 Tax=Oryza meyeriana var. granulata TaxID=110450 RepID=A0A6G1CN69_9ORYZ|nr:hypothetical protein E2562_003570 [Oryza meyeriana var. granulata]